MDFADYQQQAAQTAVYPRSVVDFGMAYCTLKLNGEIAELSDKLAEIMMAPEGDFAALVEGVRKETGDVYWYIANLALEARVTVGEGIRAEAHDSGYDCAIFLSRTAGAVAELVGKAYRDHGGTLTADRQAAIGAALNAMLAALAWLVTSELQTSVDAVWAANIAKLRDRQQRGVLHGSGDER